MQSLLLHTTSHTISAHSCTASSLATILTNARMSHGFAPFTNQSISDVTVSRETLSSRVQTPSLNSFPSLSSILVMANLPPSLRGSGVCTPASSLALVSSCLISGDNSVEMRLSISLWNACVCESISLCKADCEWFREVASALKVLDERMSLAFALVYGLGFPKLIQFCSIARGHAIPVGQICVTMARRQLWLPNYSSRHLRGALPS